MCTVCTNIYKGHTTHITIVIILNKKRLRSEAGEVAYTVYTALAKDLSPVPSNYKGQLTAALPLRILYPFLDSLGIHMRTNPHTKPHIHT